MVFWSFFETVPLGIRENPVDQQMQRVRPPDDVNRNDANLIIGNSQRDFSLWVKRCFEVGEARRLPPSTFEDLIPSEDRADHALRNPFEFAKELAFTFPGRIEWLDFEGVGQSDVEEFWGTPPWVQNFREALVKREFELQLASTVEGGTDLGEAVSIALFFLPTFSIAPPSSDLYRRIAQLPFPDNPALENSGLLPEPLPWELFSRVNRFLSQHTGQEIEKLNMGHGVIHFNDLCRKMINSHEI